VMRSLIQRCATRARGFSWASGMLKRQERLSECIPWFQYSALNSDCVREDTTGLCPMHYGGRPHSCNDLFLHFDRSARLEIPSLVMSGPPALRRSKNPQGMTGASASGCPDDSRQANVGIPFDW
jgi:hypothetical protein